MYFLQVFSHPMKIRKKYSESFEKPDLALRFNERKRKEISIERILKKV